MSICTIDKKLVFAQSIIAIDWWYCIVNRMKMAIHLMKMIHILFPLKSQHFLFKSRWWATLNRRLAPPVFEDHQTFSKYFPIHWVCSRVRQIRETDNSYPLLNCSWFQTDLQYLEEILFFFCKANKILKTWVRKASKNLFNSTYWFDVS